MTNVLQQTAEALVNHCRNHTESEGLQTLYAPDAVSVEAAIMPGKESAETKGIAGIQGKHDWWNTNFEVHGSSVGDPLFHGDDRFAMTFEMDATNKESGERTQMKEIGVYTVNGDGKITREEFFYVT